MHPPLLAVLPPANVERLVGDIREELFRRHGLASALALPALLPLGFLPAGPLPAGVQMRQIRSAFPAAFPMEAGGLRVERDLLVLEVKTGGRLGRLREALQRLLPLTDGFLPPLEGFFLAAREHLADPGAALAGLPPPAIPRFSVFDLAFLEIRIGEPGPAWWRQLYWEEIGRIPGRRPAAGQGP